MEFFLEIGLEGEKRGRERARDQSLDGVMLKSKAYRSDYLDTNTQFWLFLSPCDLDNFASLTSNFLLLNNGLIIVPSKELCKDQQYRV